MILGADDTYKISSYCTTFLVSTSDTALPSPRKDKLFSANSKMWLVRLPTTG